MKKVVGLLVLDGLGVGAMNDVQKNRKRDIGANTLFSIDRIFHSRVLDSFGFYNICYSNNFTYEHKKLRIGRCYLDYRGADSFISHHRMIGNAIDSSTCFYIENYSEELSANFSERYCVDINNDILCLDRNIFIANNIEADPGTAINVIGNLDEVSFDELISVGKNVAGIIRPLRVIVMGGKPLNWKIIRKNIKSVIDIYGNKIIGIDIPKTGMYNDDYKVFHIGIELKDSKHVLTLLKKYKKQVALIGKVSDLFKKFGNYNLNATNIDNVLDVMADCIKERKYSFVFANVQEIDLHGHAQDVYKCADALKTLDIKIPMILNNMLKDDILIIVGDHGNDPCIGHSYHTREYVPLVIIGNNIRPGFLGGNIPLGNIGATIADFCNVPLLDKNKSLI